MLAESLQSWDRRVRPRLVWRNGTLLDSRVVHGVTGHLSICMWNLQVFLDDSLDFPRWNAAFGEQLASCVCLPCHPRRDSRGERSPWLPLEARPSSVAPDPAESRGAQPPPQDPWPLRGTLGSSLRSPAEGEGHEGFPPPPDKDLASSTYKSTSGLSPHEQRESQAEFHSSTQDEA